jgi:hypothetical protein
MSDQSGIIDMIQRLILLSEHTMALLNPDQR